MLATEGIGFTEGPWGVLAAETASCVPGSTGTCCDAGRAPEAAGYVDVSDAVVREDSVDTSVGGCIDMASAVAEVATSTVFAMEPAVL
jgi:hypothetical protein